MLLDVMEGQGTLMTERINPRPTTLNPARRFSVRLTLAAGATVATLVGSQTLALLEHSSNPATASANQLAATNTALPSATVPVVAMTESTGAAPNVIIIRNPGALRTPVANKQPASRSAQPVRTSGGSGGSGGITPPNPVMEAQPVQVQASQGQQPAPVARSSR